jgi:hypothetical protein
MIEEQTNEPINNEIVPTENEQVNDGTIPNMPFNRKFRRALIKQSGYVKMKNRLGYKDWFENIKNNINNGKQLHASNTEDVIRRSLDSTDKRNESIAKFLLERGHSEEKVAEIMEKNIENQERISAKKIKP